VAKVTKSGEREGIMLARQSI